ncbi:MAG: four helix bundle protein [Tepidisphaeraceae bacterium]
MLNDQGPNGGVEPRKQFDLEERTARFGEMIIAFAKRVPVGPVTAPIISQLVRAATSVGANYCEANDAESRKDFRHKMGICRKESRENKHHLRMVAAAGPGLKDDARILWQEAKELNLIFSSIIRKLDNGDTRRER